MGKETDSIRKKSAVQIRNKKASFEYFFVETFMAGIVLTGTEIKSIRMGKASLVDSFCYANFKRQPSKWALPSCRHSCLSTHMDGQRLTSHWCVVRKSSTSGKHLKRKKTADKWTGR